MIKIFPVNAAKTGIKPCDFFVFIFFYIDFKINCLHTSSKALDTFYEDLADV